MESVTASCVTLQPVIKGGSVRRFYRLLSGHSESLGILMEYSLVKEENGLYSDHAAFLESLGVPVPRVLHHDSRLGLAWLEDLGNMDLHHYRQDPWPELKTRYHSVIQSILPMWIDGLEHAQKHQLPMMEGFGSYLYTWERDYFFDQCIRRFSSHASESDRVSLHQECSSIENLLLNAPPSLVHRDFQSQNIMIRNHQPVFIDFQGMRPGTWFYDAASLLYDPYMPLDSKQRKECAELIHQLTEYPFNSISFNHILSAAAAQRLMQALGAYGYLGVELGKTEFLKYIPTAMERLMDVASLLELKTLPRLLDDVSPQIFDQAKIN
ncbi:MAG: phosphotransferase [Candidatus Methylacidiphilales bacterium]